MTDEMNIAQKASRALRDIESTPHSVEKIGEMLAWFSLYASKMTALSEFVLDEEWLDIQISDSIDLDWQTNWAATRIATQAVAEMEEIT